MAKKNELKNSTEPAIAVDTVLATGLSKRVPWNYGKRKPEPDQDGVMWCNCLNPKLVSNSGGRGHAYCLLCHTPWYH